MTASSNRPALAGVAIAIAITTTLDASGYFMFSALTLIPLTGVLWYLQKMPRAEIGLTAGKLGDYGPALLYPLLALGLIALIAALSGAVDTSETDWNKALLNIGLMSSTGILMPSMQVRQNSGSFVSGICC